MLWFLYLAGLSVFSAGIALYSDEGPALMFFGGGLIAAATVPAWMKFIDGDSKRSK